MLKDLLKQNRSYRGYDESRRITREEMLELVDLARLVPSAANRQPLRYHIAAEKAEVDAIQALTLWAGALPQLALPYEGHRPTGFVVICHDISCGQNLMDVGIAAQTLLLGDGALYAILVFIANGGDQYAVNGGQRVHEHAAACAAADHTDRNHIFLKGKRRFHD